MKAITKRQKEVLDYISEYISAMKYPPTVREIAKNFEISPKGAYDHLKALEKKEYLRCTDNKSRAIELCNQDTTNNSPEFLSIPILGNVAAGRPILAEENWDGELELPSKMFKTGSHFALRVEGDSMIDEGILEGDLAIITQQSNASNGDIIVAQMDESVTLKTYFKESNRVRLQPANKNYNAIYTRDLKIIGKMVSLVRFYDS